MQDISGQLAELHRKVMRQEYVTPAENALADDLLRLIDIVACINNRRLERVDESARRAAHEASCLANGAKPD